MDACKLIGKTLDGASQCHTVTSLCGTSAGAGLVPWPTKQLCSLQERGWTNSAGINKPKPQVPEGIALDVHKDTSYRRPRRRRSAPPRRCTWSQPDAYTDYGMQFSLAPGYQITCDGTTQYGSAPEKAAEE